MDKTIHHMSVTELQTQIRQQEIEYKKAIEARKVFWEVKKILTQQRTMEKELIRKMAEIN